MKAKNWLTLLLGSLSMAIFIACGNGGTANSPNPVGGNGTVNINANGNGTEANIKYSFFGEGSEGSRDAIEDIWDESQAPIYQVQAFDNNINWIFPPVEQPDTEPDDCSEFGFFKPSCAPFYSHFATFMTCVNDRDYPWYIFVEGIGDCDSYSGDTALWVEQKTDDTFRVRFQGLQTAFINNGYLVEAIIDDLEYGTDVIPINNGTGLEITAVGSDLQQNWDKVFKVIIEDIDPNIDQTSTATVYYGRADDLVRVGTYRLKNINPLL
ncbi:MAG: hypothetical protein AB8E15_11500 [Bdellovibrionales bacterium]